MATPKKPTAAARVGALQSTVAEARALARALAERLPDVTADDDALALARMAVEKLDRAASDVSLLIDAVDDDDDRNP